MGPNIYVTIRSTKNQIPKTFRGELSSQNFESNPWPENRVRISLPLSLSKTASTYRQPPFWEETGNLLRKQAKVTCRQSQGPSIGGSGGAMGSWDIPGCPDVRTKSREQEPVRGRPLLEHQGIRRRNMGIISLFSLTQAVGKESPSDV